MDSGRDRGPGRRRRHDAQPRRRAHPRYRGRPTSWGRSLDVLDPAIRAVLRSSLVEHSESETEVTVTLPRGVHCHWWSARRRFTITRARSAGRSPCSATTPGSRPSGDKRRTDRLSALGAMAAGIAHEIRNPLVAIKTFAELLPSGPTTTQFRSTFAKVAGEGDPPDRAAAGAGSGPSRCPPRSRCVQLDLQVPLARRWTCSAARPIASGSAPWSRSSTTCHADPPGRWTS